MGLTDSWYQHCDAYPIYGTGQGSGNSPVIWAFISSVLFTCHAYRAKGALFESPDKTITITFHMVGFVDDSTGQVNDFRATAPPTLDHLVQLMADDAQLWNDLLYVSGGLLEVPKCSYHILYFAFHPNGIPYMETGLTSPPLQLSASSTQEHIQVQRKLSFSPHKTLGHIKSPKGNCSTHLQSLVNKTTQLAKQVTASSATRSQAVLFYWIIYIATIRYSLPQFFFSTSKLNEAQGKSFPAIIAKCGFMRTTAHAILFGPKKYGGAGFVRWTTIQGEGQILLFLKHWRANDQAGRLLRIALAWAQFQAGTSQPILSDVTTPLSYLESRWIPSLRTFLASVGATLQLDKTYVAPLQRVNDQHLMDWIVQSKTFTDKELHIINCCRLYLQVITLSDITTACGTRLDPNIMNHERSMSCSSKYHPPVQARPTNWTLWDRALAHWILPNGDLKTPLEGWLQPSNQLRCTWSAYYDRSDGYVYKATSISDEYHQCLPHFPYVISEPVKWRPHALAVPMSPDLPVPVLTNVRPPATTSQVYPTFSAYVDTLPAWERSLLQSTQFLLNPYQLEVLLRPSAMTSEAPMDVLMVSDGSQIDDKMTYGWIMSLSDGTRLVTGTGPRAGPGTSHRAEAFGVLSALRFLHHYQAYISSTAAWSIWFYTDNQGLITRIHNRRQYTVVYANSTLDADWDLVEAIVHTITHSPIRSQFMHVKGHQDKSTAYDQLTLPAQLNVDADALAGATQLNNTAAPLMPLLPTTAAALHIDARTITGHYQSCIRAAVATREYLPYLFRRHTWTTRVWHTIDTTVLGHLISRNHYRYVNTVKLIHDKLPTAKIRCLTDPSVSPHCSRCAHADESFSHLLRCSHPSRDQWRRELILIIRKHCEAQHTRLPLLQILIAGLEQWFKGKVLWPASYPTEFQTLIKQQNSIGWLDFLQGFATTLWSHHQQQHLQNNSLTSPTRTGTLWLVTLLHRI